MSKTKGYCGRRRFGTGNGRAYIRIYVSRRNRQRADAYERRRQFRKKIVVARNNQIRRSTWPGQTYGFLFTGKLVSPHTLYIFYTVVPRAFDLPRSVRRRRQQHRGRRRKHTRPADGPIWCRNEDGVNNDK